jgi:hypothetical protein
MSASMEWERIKNEDLKSIDGFRTEIEDGSVRAIYTELSGIGPVKFVVDYPSFKVMRQKRRKSWKFVARVAFKNGHLIGIVEKSCTEYEDETNFRAILADHGIDEMKCDIKIEKKEFFDDLTVPVKKEVADELPF